MDIEGAEFDALQGMQSKTLISKPHLILETSPKDMRCYNLLISMGYKALDLGNYKQITNIADFPKDSDIRNLLYVHESRLTETPYPVEPKLTQQFEYSAKDFVNQSGSWFSPWQYLKPGRYVSFYDLSGNPDDEVMVGIENEQNEICRYHANRGFLNTHYPDMPFHISEEKKCRLFLKLIKSNSKTDTPPVSTTICKMTDFQFNRISLMSYLTA